jgi:branched-chain amino acid transport system ATP-binding protein
VALLNIRNLTKYFGGLAAVNDLNLDVYQGEIVGLIGPNGAGKTTVFNMIAGTISPTRGTYTFKGKDITRLPPHRIAKQGIVRVFQRNVLFHNLAVTTNVLLGSSHMRSNIGSLSSVFGGSYSRKLEKAACEKAMETLALVGLSDKADELAVNLSHGHQRLLCLAIAVASDPELLLLDEPVTGMNAEEVSAMLSIIRMLKEERGISSIIVEHNMKAVMSLCDRIAVISYGIKIAEGSAEEISQNPTVIEAYLGVDQDVT